MEFPSNYTLDRETVKLNAYRLLCLFYANKEIARLSDPEKRDDPASLLEREFFSREMTHLLLSIAISLRVLDDQMTARPEESDERKRYLRVRADVNSRHNCMMFDDMSLRKVCNKIIHASTVEAHTQEGAQSHKIDEYNWLGWVEAREQDGEETGPQPDPIEWHHLTSNIRLGGVENGVEWWHLLEVPTFVDAVFELLSDGG